MPSWIWIALLCAFLTGTADAAVKQLLAKGEERMVGWGKLFFALPWLIGMPIFFGWPALGIHFWMVLAIMVPMEIVAYLCALRSLRLAPLSLTIPFQAITPLLTVMTGFLLMGERVSLSGFVGILCITAGAYVLQLHFIARGWFEPFREMGRNPGIRLMLISAAIYSVAATLSKRAVQLSSAEAFPFLYLATTTLFLTPIARQGAKTSGGFLFQIRSQRWLFLLTGLLTAGSFLTHCLAIQFAPVAYFISIKRLSLLISVLYGGFWFGEESFLQRTLGAGLMFLGSILITLTS